MFFWNTSLVVQDLYAVHHWKGAKENAFGLRTENCLEARSTYQNTQGWPVPKQVRETLDNHGIQADESFSTAHYLEDEEVSHFSSFVAISRGAMDRLSLLGLPEEKVKESQVFFGVWDPALDRERWIITKTFTPVSDDPSWKPPGEPMQATRTTGMKLKGAVIYE